MTRCLPTIAVLFGVFLLLCGARQSRADDNIFPAAPSAKASIDFDGRGFLIHGRRTPILSAGMEYARVPRALWRDRLLRFKRAGFNCVEMYTFWNYHEPQEGKFDFSGDHDLDAYLKLVHQMGMYAICRVGPYYCAEWDGGGYPVWLRFKTGVHVRTDDPRFLAAMDPFFDKLLPIVAANQVNHGGAVVLVQLENEDPAGWGRVLPDAYFKHLQAKALALGIEVPYFFSGLHHGSDPAGSHSWDSVGRTSPWMSTEFWSVWYDHYGARPEDADTYERRTWKILAYGGNGYNDYMAHGGTNFGYTNDDEDAASYDYGAAVGQAGDLRPIYYRYKRINWFALSFPEVLEDSVNADADFQGAATNPAIRVTARKSPSGTLLFLDNPGKTAVQTQIGDRTDGVLPPSGPLTLRPGEIVPVVRDCNIAPGVTLHWGVSRIFGIVHQGHTTTLVTYGQPQTPGMLWFTTTQQPIVGRDVAGRLSSAGPHTLYMMSVFPAAGSEECTFSVGPETVRILAMSETLADHTWFVPVGTETAIICGPGFVGDAAGAGGQVRLTTERGLSAAPGISPSPYAEAAPALIYAPGMDGVPLAARTPSAQTLSPKAAAAPPLSGWETQPETQSSPRYDDANWLATADPMPMGADGDASAYAWYRTTLRAPAAEPYALTFSGASDRIIPFLDGIRVADASVHQSTVDLALTPGTHAIAILAIHYGRAKLFGYTGPLDAIDVKGLVGPAHLRVSDGSGTALASWRMVRAGADHLAPPAPDAPGWTDVKIGEDAFHGSQSFTWFQTVIPASLLRGGSGQSQLLQFSSVDDNATVFLNGKQVASHKGWNEAFSVLLDAASGGGRPIVLSVLVQNTSGPGGLDGPITLLSYRSDAPVVGWKMRGGIETGLSESAWVPLAASTLLDGSPRYYRTRFRIAPSGASGLHPILRLVTGPLSAGFVWLNGHNLGRYPEKIPINGLYLPECWLRAGENTLVVFDEDGKRPTGVALEVETVASRVVAGVTTQPGVAAR